jgi:predicted unusual protein kinase regulating ubiquinone biosynthesis (AarF/ABC1/UbiB family)
MYDIINKNKNILFEQINLKKELENIKLFKKKYKNRDYIIIPEVYEEFTEKFNNLILMEFIEGDTIHNIKKEDKENFQKLLFKYNYSFLEKEIVHGDLHIGNILFCKTNDKYKIGLIDFGIIFKLDKYELDFAYFLLKTTDVDDFLKTLLKLLKNYLKLRSNKLKNIDDILSIIFNEISLYCKENAHILNNNNFLHINLVKYLFYRLNYYKLEIDERIANLLITISLINSITLYFTNVDSITKNKELNKLCKKFELE